MIVFVLPVSSVLMLRVKVIPVSVPLDEQDRASEHGECVLAAVCFIAYLNLPSDAAIDHDGNMSS